MEAAQYYNRSLTQQSQSSLSGVAANLRKAFNIINRSLTWNLAEHLQGGKEVLFHQQHPSSTGPPLARWILGRDSLCILHVVQQDMSCHYYTAAPSRHTLSYVDNHLAQLGQRQSNISAWAKRVRISCSG